MKSYNHLQEKIVLFEETLERRKMNRETKSQKQKQELNQLQQYFEERTNSMINKIEDLKRKQTILITLIKIEPSLPEQFPKNYYFQITYEDAVLTGNQKFIDFDENIIEEKFVLPLLFSTIIHVEIWVAEDDPSLFDKGEINLQRDIENAMISDSYEGEITFVKLPDIQVTYRLQIQGIGFSSWLKNISEMRELEAQKAYSRQQGKLKKEQTRKKLQQKKEKFNQKFNKRQKQTTAEYCADPMNQILQQLQIE